MLAFIDETGDHNLEKIDPLYALFGLGALIIEEEEYGRMDSVVQAIKKEYFSDDGTFILHSSELKRPVHKESDKRNVVMRDAQTRRAFYDDFDRRVISEFQFKIVACFIRKQTMADNYVTPADPYYFSFENILNRIITHGGNTNAILAEKRGDELNAELEAEYERLSKIGIHFHSADTVMARTSFKLIEKRENVNGLQVIDLILACLARHYLGKTEKMIGNDLTPLLLEQKYACPPTKFPYRKRS